MSDSSAGTRIVIPDDFPPVFDGHPAVERLKAAGEVAIYTTLAGSQEELFRRLEGATVALRILPTTCFDAALLDRLADLRFISISGTGVDNIDFEAADRLGVAVCNAPGANARSVAEHAIALMFAVARQIPRLDRETRAGEWSYYPGPELEGKTLGVIGLGNIGQQVAKMGNGLGMRVVAWSFTHDEVRARACGAELVERDELLRRADVVSLCLPATPESRRMIGVGELALMRPDAILINTARAALVDEEALLDALRGGRLAGAGLDVFADEPLPADSPYFTLDNVVLTPHVAWATREAFERLIQIPIDNILAFLAGEPRNIVNPASLHQRLSQ